ncbi:hypothetical protein [Nonomuraea sp. NPDC049158]
MSGRKLTADELSKLMDSLSDEQKRYVMAYFCGHNEEAFHMALMRMGGGD